MQRLFTGSQGSGADIRLRPFRDEQQRHGVAVVLPLGFAAGADPRKGRVSWRFRRLQVISRSRDTPWSRTEAAGLVAAADKGERASKHLRPSAALRPRLAPPFPPSPPNPTFLSLALSKTARTGNSARAHLLGLLVPREFFLRVLLHHFSRFLHLKIAKHLVKLCVGGCGGLMNFPRSR